MTVTEQRPTDEEHINRIRRRFATVGCAQLADAAPEFVVPLHLPAVPRNGRPRVCGPVFPVATTDDMLPALQALAQTPPGHVLFIHNTVTRSEAIVGDIFLTSAAVQRLGGIVVDGAVRDLTDLAVIDVPVFSTQVTFVSARTTSQRAIDLPQTVEVAGTAVRPGDWLFGDPDGFLLLPADRVGAVFAAGAVLRDREEALKKAMQHDGKTLADLTHLDDFLDGTGDLGFTP
ncbi:RraA family protein [Micromonospora sediminimaris]|uniref:Putative 4-hydroxy-4-methyl-2-oxoglutarate aldolase n=1 Tax=Micromonospora sediminimaris TaxID=547162 RepID=A0A9W5XLZ9_9ACTN|nr:RraA family protein [Micromonospora sediminimaris]GIJ35900.1 demethylmenaquinone methyltransferase [Micromonospora sediminimaris]SFD42911.1 4-hydroxy-4-methyl-2-oxoglutarate aldolase [Micromonospora sediminimaris]